MAEPQRRRDEESGLEQKTRERERKLLALRRLNENPDFAVLREFLQVQLDARLPLLMRAIVTEQDKTDHNQFVGETIGLRLALQAAETLREAEAERTGKL